MSALLLALSGCASVNPELLSLSSVYESSPVVLALAPAIEPSADEIVILNSDQEAARLAQLTGAPPPPQDGLVIQGEPVSDGYGGGYRARGYQGGLEPAPYNPPAHAPYYQPAYVDEGDPFEGLNRHVFHLNDTLDMLILEPLARTYRHITPVEARVAVRNFASNLESPVTLANDLLQGEFDRAHVTFSRFVINSTVGFAGLHDPATEMGYEAHREDFDQTLALHGIPSGPYLVVPILGPATPRHLVGRVVDSAFHPLTWILAGEPIAVSLAARAADGVAAREEVLDTLEAMKSTSTDYYVAVQSLYRQNRIGEINNGQMMPGGAGGGIDLSEDLDLDF